jgi:hypothetical protein
MEPVSIGGQRSISYYRGKGAQDTVHATKLVDGALRFLVRGIRHPYPAGTSQQWIVSSVGRTTTSDKYPHIDIRIIYKTNK